MLLFVVGGLWAGDIEGGIEPVWGGWCATWLKRGGCCSVQLAGAGRGYAWLSTSPGRGLWNDWCLAWGWGGRNIVETGIGQREWEPIL